MKFIPILLSCFVAVSAIDVSSVAQVVELLAGFSETIEKESNLEKNAWEHYEVQAKSIVKEKSAELMVGFEQAKTLRQKEIAFLEAAKVDMTLVTRALISTLDFLDETTQGKVLVAVKALTAVEGFLHYADADVHLKGDLVWKPVLNTDADIQMKKHLALYKHAEDVIASLPAENTFVRQTLSEALDHLKSADNAYLKETHMSSHVAGQKLDGPAGHIGFDFSSKGLLYGGKQFLKTVTNLFIGGGSDPVQQPSGILPALRGAPDITGSALYNLRLASKKGFDVLKYDIYHQGVPKTPQVAKDIADQIVDAAGDTRHRFMMSMIDMIHGITKDAQGKHEDAGSPMTKTKASLSYNAVAKISSAKDGIYLSSSKLIDV